MQLTQPDADVFVPNAEWTRAEALARTTHLCVAAHQDDIEIMAYHGIAECFRSDDRWFGGVVVTNGSSSPRAGAYANCSDEEMQAIRRKEQRKAAQVGDYSIQLQLAHPSSAVKDVANAAVQADLVQVFLAARAKVVYLHQPADKHDTHVAVLGHALAALRALPRERRPERVLGCEVWRDLDWMCDADKQALDAGRYPHLAAALVGVFDSQISGGKRYDLATAGRRLAHATFHTSHATDRYQGLTWAMDLTPLIGDNAPTLREFTRGVIERFQREVEDRLMRCAGASASRE